MRLWRKKRRDLKLYSPSREQTPHSLYFTFLFLHFPTLDFTSLFQVCHLERFGETSGLGISLEARAGHHYLCSVLPEGPVGQSSKIFTGDQILEVTLDTDPFGQLLLTAQALIKIWDDVNWSQIWSEWDRLVSSVAPLWIILRSQYHSSLLRSSSLKPCTAVDSFLVNTAQFRV